MQTPLPQRIGRYEILRELGRGMMGVVYQAKDPALNRNVALKTISLDFAVSESERETFEARFLQEARAAAGLSHPSIVVVYDVGVDAAVGTLYMALEFLRGKTLEAILAAGDVLDWREALRTTGRVADALHHAHAHGIIHRDIKPANIMVLPTGEPKIMDFGVAKLEAGQLTAAGQVLGSPSYMSPEQADGQALDARSDLFSLGAVLYELLTGKKAFPGRDLPTVLMRVAHENPAAPSMVNAGLPRMVDALVAGALAKNPADRYPSGKALAEDIEDVLADRSPRHLAASPSKPPKTMESRTGPQPSPTAAAVGEGTVRGGTVGGVGSSLPQGKRVCLALLSGARQGEVFVLSRPTVLIGRSGGRAGADIELADPEVSRAHAVVECHGNRVVVRDLGSTNGTFVESERIEERDLEDRSEFRVGGTRLMLIISDAD
jgi:eukaryotic-like serine/threonine-protein kinase